MAEEIVYGKITTGAESDIQQLTQIARQVVGRWGMSDKVGPITVLPTDGNGPLLPGASETSPQTQYLVDQEVRRIVDEARAEVTRLLTDHRDQLEALTNALLAAETLDAADAYAAAQMKPQATESEPATAEGRVASWRVAAEPGGRNVGSRSCKFLERDAVRSGLDAPAQCIGGGARPAQRRLKALLAGSLSRGPGLVIEHMNTEGGPTDAAIPIARLRRAVRAGSPVAGCSV